MATPRRSTRGDPDADSPVIYTPRARRLVTRSMSRGMSPAIKNTRSPSAEITEDSQSIFQGLYDMWDDLYITDKITLVWFAIDALTHLVLEASFLYFALFADTAKNNPDNYFASIWIEYAKADSRWDKSDATIIAIELMTVVVEGPLCLVMLYAILKKKSYRHVLQLIISIGEIYGGWMTFGVEWVINSPSLNTDSFKYKWIYLFFMNFLWVWIPAVLTTESIINLNYSQAKLHVAGRKKTLKLQEGSVMDLLLKSNAIWLLVYIVAVPLALYTK